MRSGMWMVAGACLLASCANLAIPIAYTDGHVEEIVKAAEEGALASTEGTVEARQFKILHFHATRAKTWTKAMTDHKGPPPETVVVPEGPEDTREIEEENAKRREYKAEVKAEKDLKAKGWAGLKGLLGLGVGGGGLGIAGLLWRNRRKLLQRGKKILADNLHQKKALDQYNAGVDQLPKKQRNAFKGAEMEEEHALRENGNGNSLL